MNWEDAEGSGRGHFQGNIPVFAYNLSHDMKSDNRTSVLTHFENLGALI
jgi:hypothetical protein